eukprot:GFUD01051497.1.p1 GENE.GFUD01051497.1~~GFUD01051497.1.p1  ORF type:complete len:345 (-),score=126.50 GFUD01051497.1:218-1252(-)
MESELQTGLLVQGSTIDNLAVLEDSSPTNIVPESDEGSVDGLNKDDKKDANEERAIFEESSNKMAEAALYVGRFFDPSTWNGTFDKNSEGEEEESKPNSSSSLFSALSKDPVLIKLFTNEETKTTKDDKSSAIAEVENNEENKEENAVKENFVSSAFSKIGISNLTSSKNMENIVGYATMTEANKECNNDEEKTWDIPFSNAFNKVGKVATDYTKVVQDAVYMPPLLVEFNQDQEDFIKSKEKKEMPTAPWTGFQNEDELKTKIIELSEDKRNFLRAQPTGVKFDFETLAIAYHAEVLLEADPRLQKMRYELVPKKVEEEKFWSNYFYRVGLVKQSFEVSNSWW